MPTFCYIFYGKLVVKHPGRVVSVGSLVTLGIGLSNLHSSRIMYLEAGIGLEEGEGQE